MSPKVANLGNGNLYVEGFTNVDLFAARADVRHDLDIFPYPFEDSSFDEIRAHNIVEHLTDVVAVMRELHRIGKDGCLVTIRVPHFRSACLYEDLTHRHGFAWRSFDIFVDHGEVYGDYADFRYEIVSRAYTPYLVPLLYRVLSRVPLLTDHLLSKFIPMASIEFVLKVRKKLD